MLQLTPFSYRFSVEIIVVLVNFYVLLQTLLLGLKVIYTPLLQYWIILNLSIYLYLPVSFIYSYIFKLLISILSFQLEKLPLTFPTMSVLWWGILSAFFCLGKSLHLFHFWRAVLLSIVFLFGRFFFFLQYFDYIIPFCPDWQDFCWEICL